MKFVIFLMSVVFMLTACGRKQVKSVEESKDMTSPEDIVQFEDSAKVEELVANTKFTEAIVVNEETGKVCSVDLRGKADLQFSFVNEVAENDGTPFEEVSFLKEPVLCDSKKEQALVTLAPQTVYGTPLEDDTMLASLSKNLIESAGLAVACGFAGVIQGGIFSLLEEFILSIIDDEGELQRASYLLGIIAFFNGYTASVSRHPVAVLACGLGAGVGQGSSFYLLGSMLKNF